MYAALTSLEIFMRFQALCLDEEVLLPQKM